jgi:hypothetical protein
MPLHKIDRPFVFTPRHQNLAEAGRLARQLRRDGAENLVWVCSRSRLHGRKSADGPDQEGQDRERSRASQSALDGGGMPRGPRARAPAAGCPNCTRDVWRPPKSGRAVCNDVCDPRRRNYRSNVEAWEAAQCSAPSCFETGHRESTEIRRGPNRGELSGPPVDRGRLQRIFQDLQDGSGEARTDCDRADAPRPPTHVRDAPTRSWSRRSHHRGYLGSAVNEYGAPLFGRCISARPGARPFVKLGSNQSQDQTLTPFVYSCGVEKGRAGIFRCRFDGRPKPGFAVGFPSSGTRKNFGILLALSYEVGGVERSPRSGVRLSIAFRPLLGSQNVVLVSWTTFAILEWGMGNPSRETPAR